MELNSTIKLNDGTRMPIFGLGTFRTEPGDTTEKTTTHALQHGYRMIDTATYYQNEESVGRAVRGSGLKREDIFVVTKLMWDRHGERSCKEAFMESFKKLDIGYIDLYLIHSPVGNRLVETYSALLPLKQEGLVRSLGVSNFGVQHLEGLQKAGLPTPSVNQFELHPWQSQRKAPVVEYCLKNGIAVMGYSPLAKSKKMADPDPSLVELATKYQKSVAQILIRWSLQRGFITIPKSSKCERVDENATVFDFSLSEAEMSLLNNFPDFGCTWDPTRDPWVN